MREIPLEPQIPTNAFLRLLFMLIFFALFGVVRMMTWVIVLFQFLSHLFTGRVTDVGSRWGKGLSDWTHQMLLFMTYNTERMPFPFHAIGADED
jgi:hypothetical protein